MTADNAPLGRQQHRAVWADNQMIVWGGYDDNYTFLNSGGRYCSQPATPTPCPSVAPILSEDFDGMTPPALPTGWIAVNAIDPDAILWTTSNSGVPTPAADSPPNSASINDPAVLSDKHLYSPPIVIASPYAQLTFRNNFDLENSFDGGVWR